ncbi:MAG TPA: heme ABC exporter ATP-binding protein CcmA [Terriglobia bacterium]|nr:heme ABC exporter ATP-binding protein CcmA [Terriglobia bacterium]
MPADAASAKPILELRGVSKYYGDLVALRHVELRVEPGDAVLLYGPNGAGKTTLLRTMAALSRPTEGEVLFNGEDIHRNAGLSKARVGFVSHTTFLYGELTGRENLRFAGTLFGLRDLERKIDRALDLFAVRERASEPVRGLSRGLQQRVSLARAFLHDPDFLLLDEPFTGLDAAAVESLETILRRLPSERKAIIFSNHDFEQGVALSRRLVALERGRLRYDGPLSLAPLESLGIAPAGKSQA